MLTIRCSPCITTIAAVMLGLRLLQVRCCKCLSQSLLLYRGNYGIHVYSCFSSALACVTLLSSQYLCNCWQSCEHAATNMHNMHACHCTQYGSTIMYHDSKQHHKCLISTYCATDLHRSASQGTSILCEAHPVPHMSARSGLCVWMSS